jgi:hypothetical protein
MEDRPEELAPLLREVIARLADLRQAMSTSVARGGLTQQFNGFGLTEVAQIAAREAGRVLRAYDDNRAFGRPAFSGIRSE